MRVLCLSWQPRQAALRSAGGVVPLRVKTRSGPASTGFSLWAVLAPWHETQLGVRASAPAACALRKSGHRSWLLWQLAQSAEAASSTAA
jgi:hypothetical protein